MMIGITAAWLYSWPAQAGCGFDPVCAISESIGSGAGKGVADSIRPLVTDVMEREAPALIAQLQAGVDHNIMTAEQAGEKLTGYATNLLNKAADDFLGNAANRTQSLIDYAAKQTSDIEQQVFNDVQKIIADLHCETLNVSTLAERQQKIFDESANDFLSRILFWQKRQSKVESQCRAQLGIDPSLKTADMQLPTSWKLWRCVRLAYVDPSVDLNGKSTAIRDAYADVDLDESETMCALKTDSVPLKLVTEAWIADTQNAKAWDRAIRGE